MKLFKKLPTSENINHNAFLYNSVNSGSNKIILNSDVRCLILKQIFKNESFYPLVDLIETPLSKGVYCIYEVIKSLFGNVYKINIIIYLLKHMDTNMKLKFLRGCFRRKLIEKEEKKKLLIMF